MRMPSILGNSINISMRMKILVVGISGVYNYGCEAIVRGTCEIVRRTMPSAEITYLSLDYDFDVLSLKDLDLRVVNGCPSSIVARAVRKLIRGLRMLGLARQCGSWYPMTIRDYDVVLSIGGDIYTIGANTKAECYVNPLVELGESFLSLGKRYVMWGCSVGPFGRLPAVEQYFARHLTRCSVVVSRESDTTEYLRELGCNNVIQVADPAFLMEAVHDDEISLPVGAPLIGLNVSELSLRARFPREQWSERRRDLIGAICRLLDIPSAVILLIPHVQPDDQSEDDDVQTLEALATEIDSDRVVLLKPGIGARATKGVISRCDLLLAARMHCAIAGVSVGVPTVFLSYSQKARGMAKYVYGDEGYCLDLAEVKGDILLEVSRRMISSAPSIRAGLLSRLPMWRIDALKAGAALLDRCDCE